MKTATVVAWAVVLVGIVLVSLAPISPEDLPEGVVRSGFRMAHAPAYAVLAALTLRFLLVIGWLKSFPQAVLASAAASILLGGAIELLQPYFGRSASLQDFVMNTVGVIVALVLLVWIRGRVAGHRAARQLSTSE